MPLADGRRWRIGLEELRVDFDGGEPFVCSGDVVVFSAEAPFVQGGLALVEWEREIWGAGIFDGRGTSLVRAICAGGCMFFATPSGWAPRGCRVTRCSPVVAVFSAGGRLLEPAAGELRYRAELAASLARRMVGRPGEACRKDAEAVAAMLAAEWGAEAAKRQRSFWERPLRGVAGAVRA
jgi:hypothetical protein